MYLLFPIQMTNIDWICNCINWKKCRCCAWDSNPGRRMVVADDSTEPPNAFGLPRWLCAQWMDSWGLKWEKNVPDRFFQTFFCKPNKLFFLLNRLAQSLPQFLMSKDGVLKSEQINLFVGSHQKCSPGPLLLRRHLHIDQSGSLYSRLFHIFYFIKCQMHDLK